MELKVNSTRSEAFDIARGLLMVMVILGHGIQFVGYAGRNDFWSDPLFKVIYMFHMPLFMGYSGYFSLGRKMHIGDILARAKALIYPMIPWAVLAATLRVAVHRNPSEFLPLAWCGFIGTYWFLWATFIGLFLVWAGEKLGRASLVFYCLVLAGLMTNPGQWSVLPMLAFTLPFFIAGRIFRKHQGRDFAMPRFFPFYILPIAVICFIFWNFDTYVYNNHAYALMFPWSVMLMFVGAAASTAVAAAAFYRVGVTAIGTKIGGWLGQIGRVTLEIYLVQSLIFAAVGVAANHLPGAASDYFFGRLTVSIVASAVILAAILFFVSITRRNWHLSRVVWGR